MIPIIRYLDEVTAEQIAEEKIFIPLFHERYFIFSESLPCEDCGFIHDTFLTITVGLN